MATAIVCGGRDFSDAARLAAVMSRAVDKFGIDTIIEGEARGADNMARDWAMKNGLSVIAVPADWDDGKDAGPARNQMMLTILLRSESSRIVIAFPGGRGTAHMTMISRRAGVEVYEIPA